MFNYGLSNVVNLLSIKGYILATDVADILKSAENTELGSDSSFSPMIKKVTEIGTGGYKLVFTAMMFLFIVGGLIAFIKLFFSNSATRNDSKSDIVWKLVAAVCGFGVIGLFILLSNVGSSLFS